MRPLLLFAILPALAACQASYDSGSSQGNGVAPSGTGTSRSYAIADFSKVDLRGPDDTDVRVGGQFAVRATGPVKLLDDLVLTRDGDTLKIGRRNGMHLGFTAGRDVKVFVTMPKIAGASIAGSGDMSIDRIDGGDFSGAIAGSGDMTIAHLAVDSADLSISGSGDLEATGAVKRLSVSSAGSGEVSASGLTAASAKVSVAGSGDVTAKVDGPATVAVLGSGDVDLGANAQCTTSKMGSGSVTCAH